MIKPEVGMPVVYHQHDDDHFSGGRQLAGVITKIWGDACVNLVIFDGNGLTQTRASVLLWNPEQDATMAPGGGRWCQFPNWFLRLMAPPAFFHPSSLTNDVFDDLLKLRPAHWQAVPYAGTLPAASIDSVQCGVHELVGLNAERPDFQLSVQPTSQVLG